jgi:hypothetical protein
MNNTFVSMVGLMAFSLPVICQADQKTLDFVDSRYAQIESVSNQLWDLAELGYLETKSSAILQQHWSQRRQHCRQSARVGGY